MFFPNGKSPVFVTGGAGFIGSAVVRNLLDNHDVNVVIIDKLTYAGNLDSLGKYKESERLIIEKVDIVDQDGIYCLFKKFRPCNIMHLAAESHVDRSIEDPLNFITTNVMGTFNLLDQARKFYASLVGCERDNFRFHHVSTDEVFGDLDGTSSLFQEDTPYAPSSPYSATKAASDHLVRAWGRTYGLPIIVTNCSNNYGPYHFPEKLIPHVILNAIHGRSLPIYGDGLQIRDWLYVEDHADALIKVLSDGTVGETYNIGGHNEKTNFEVVTTICDLLEELAPEKPPMVKHYRDLITYVKDRPGHDVRYAIDASKIERELEWVPKETFESGLRKTVQWYLDNRDWWGRVLSGEYRLERIGQ